MLNSQDTKIETLADGMISLIQKNIIAHTKFVSDARKGDMVIKVNDTLRFDKGDQILLLDNNSVWDDDANIHTGLEFHTVSADVVNTNYLTLNEPLQQDFLVENNARLQKTIKNIPLYPKDVYYGDRAVADWDYVCICVEPSSMTPSWMALGGMLSTEYKMTIMVYVRMGNLNDSNLPTRVCHAYADAIHKLLIGNIHVDLDVVDVPLLADANIGDNFVYVSQDVASSWVPDQWAFYSVQDNFNQEFILIVNPSNSSSSISSSSSLSPNWSTWSSSSSSSSLNLPNTSSSSSYQSALSTMTQAKESSSLSSQSSGQTPPGVKIWLNRPLRQHYRVGDKAVLRKKYRYMYDSRITDIQYGNMQKGEVVKAALLSWFGKETQWVKLMEIGKGGNSYN